MRAAQPTHDACYIQAADFHSLQKAGMTRKGKEAAGEHKVNGCICSMPVQNQGASRDLSAVIV